MRKSIVVGAVIGAALAALGVGIVVSVHPEENVSDTGTGKFALSSELQEGGELKEITATEFEQLIAEKKSFIVVARMVICPAEFPVTDVAKSLAKTENLTIYSLMEDEFKQTILAETIKYLPSVALIHDGELADYLDAEADEDLPYYKSVDGLKTWLTQKIEL